jgi:hypothetical protein
MRVRTLFLYLIGDRQAVIDVAADRRALWIGCVFVLSAGLAREYDGKDLVHEPWHLAIPFAASLVFSWVVFGILYEVALKHDWKGPSFWRSYRSFLTLFWMTAPLAWIYAIPYERFMDPLEATEANLTSLAVVAFWRVTLMSRATSILMGCSFAAAAFSILFVADVVALVAVSQAPFPLIEVMGGVRLTPSEAMVREITLSLGCWGLLGLPVFVIGLLVILCQRGRAWQMPEAVVEADRVAGQGLGWLAVGSVFFWLPILPFTQREQLLRSHVETELQEGQIADALAEMSRHRQEDFPPHWEPPPKLGYREAKPDLLAVMEEIVQHPPADWVRNHYRKLFSYFIESIFATFPENPQRGRGSEVGWQSDVERVAKILQELPEGADLMRDYLNGEPTRFEYGERFKRLETTMQEMPVSFETKKRLKELLKAATPTAGEREKE